MREVVIGKYIRLSQADLDLAVKDDKTESESITHQRALIQEFIDGAPDLCGCRQYEFFDDGYSGTNFDRPAFEKLIERLRTGEINCVIVKDFSRFGRDYIELGDYLERIFPFLGVRFISINDHYDSADYKETTGGLDVVMKNIVYDYYSKDLSAKVTAANRTRMRRGEYIGGHVPYGLMKDPEDKHKLMPDPEAAAVVRRIFDSALAGNGTAAIARMLNEDGVETPAQYYRRKHPESKKFANLSDACAWNTRMIGVVLKQELYYGAMVGHKREQVSPCSKQSRLVPSEEVIIVEGMHEAIVTKEEWLRAQSVIRAVRAGSQCVSRDYMLKSVLRCGCCGRLMEYNGRNKERSFRCEASRNDPYSGCYQGRLPAEPVEAAVTEALRVLFASADGMRQKLLQKRQDAGDTAAECAKRLAALQERLEKLETEKFWNVDCFMAGERTQEEYLVRRQRLHEEEEHLKKELDVEEQRYRELGAPGGEPDLEIDRFLENVERCREQEPVTNEVVKTFIEKVLVYEPGRIEIVWRFSDRVMEMVRGSE